MSPILVPWQRWYTEHAIPWPADVDGPFPITDLTVTSWDAFPPTTVTLTWTVPEDAPSFDPTAYEVRAFPDDDGVLTDWPGWDGATILASDVPYVGGIGDTEVATVGLWSPAPRNGWLFCVRSVDADNNLSADSNIAEKHEWHTGYYLPLSYYGG
jgi:hypothetical protein